MKKINKIKNGNYQYLVWGNFITDGFIVRHKKHYLDIFNRRKIINDVAKLEAFHSFNDEEVYYVNSKDHKINMILAYLDIEPGKLILLNDVLVNKLLAKSLDREIQIKLSKDVNNYVRREIAINAEEDIAKTLIEDEDDEVRLQVLKRIKNEELPSFLNDHSYLIRCEVAKRIEPKYLKYLENDLSDIVRMAVCQRNEIDICINMISDHYFKIRAYLSTIDINEISKILMHDNELYVREHVAKYCSNIEILTHMIENDNSLIRRHIAKRGISKLFYLFENETDPLIKKDLKKFDFFSFHW